MAQWTPQQLQQMAALLQGTHNNLAVDAALAGAPAQRWAVDANGRRVDPYSANSAVAAIESASPAPPMPEAPAQAYAPSAPRPAPQRPVARSTAQMRSNPLFGTPAGGLMALMGGIFRSRQSAPRTGSVAEMERRHSGGSSYSGGPAVGGEYASSGR